MKKYISIIMAMVMLFCFAACSNSSNNTETTASESAVTSPTEPTKETNSNNSSDNSKTLVVYFSASGNTKNAAEYIADTTNGDLFEIQPKDTYTDADLNWRDEGSRVNFEHDNENARDIELVSSTVDNWEEYDTVFIGYPIWWGIAAWPVDTFVKSNDFTGKTVIPFATSTSSGLGESGKLLEDMAKTGDWLEGKRFPSSVSESEITEWINTLGL